MKQVIIVLVLFGLMIGGIVWNGVYINKEGSRISARLAELPEMPGEEAARMSRALEEDWKKESKIVGLSVGVTAMDRVSETLALLVAAAECGDYYGYCAARALLFDVADDLPRLERFRIDNLI